MSKQDYLAFRVSTLRGDQKISFDAYVRVAGKYILFCREGDSFEGDRLKRLRNKNLQKMYVRRDQAKEYESYLKENITRAYDLKKDVPLEQRVQIIQGAVQAATEDLIEELDNEAFYRVAVEAVKKFKDFLFQNPSALKVLLEIKNEDFNVSHHGVNVAALSLLLAKQLGHAENRPMQMAPFAVGALLHDLEHNYTPVTLSVPPKNLALNEQQVYRRHNLNGTERIKEIQFYDPLIKDIVKLHHEKTDGTGPMKHKEKDIDPLVFLVAAADRFDRMQSQLGLSAKDTMKKLLIDELGVIPLESLQALQEVLKTSKAL